MIHLLYRDSHYQTYQQSCYLLSYKYYAEKLAQEIVFDKTTDEHGDHIYTVIVENTSDIEFDTLQYDVQFKDSDGIVVGNDYVYFKNFTPRTKQKVELTFISEDTATLELSLDYLALK